MTKNKVTKQPKPQPEKVVRITCPKCKELLMKIYPYAIFNQLIEGRPLVGCKKCNMVYLPKKK